MVVLVVVEDGLAVLEAAEEVAMGDCGLKKHATSKPDDTRTVACSRDGVIVEIVCFSGGGAVGNPAVVAATDDDDDDGDDEDDDGDEETEDEGTVSDDLEAFAGDEVAAGCGDKMSSVDAAEFE